MIKPAFAPWIALVIISANPLQAVTGDINCDGRVDFADFFVFVDNFGAESEVGSECASLVGDFDCNRIVDSVDFFLFSDNFGQSGALEPACGGLPAKDFHTPQTLADILATNRSVVWTPHSESPANLTRLSFGVSGTEDVLVIDDSDDDHAATVKVEADMAASPIHTNDALIKAMFKLIEVGAGSYMMVSTKHSNFAVDFALDGGIRTLIMRDYRSFYMDTSTAGFLTFTFATEGGTTRIAADGRYTYSALSAGFVVDGSWTALNVAVDGPVMLTTEEGTPFTAFSLYMPILDQQIPFDFNPTDVQRVSNDEFPATWDGSDRLANSIRDVLDDYADQVATAGLDDATTTAADAMLVAIETTLEAEGSALRYPIAFYQTVRASMLARKVQVADNFDTVIGQNTIPYVYFTNEADDNGVHHPFMVIASYGVTEGMTHLWDVPRPPGDGTPGTQYDEQMVTRNAGTQGYFARIPMRAYGEVQSLTENTMENDLASDDPASVAFDHLNYASVSATGIAIDGVVVYPTLNNSLNVSASVGEISSVGIHSGQGLGVHYHADAHSATESGFNLYNAIDYDDHSHPPIISFGFDGVAGYGIYPAGDTSGDGAVQDLDDWGGHDHDVFGYHYHSETAEKTVTVQGPGGGTVDYTAHMLPPKGAWRGRINEIPEFWDGRAPAYGGRPGRYQGIEEK